MITAYKVKNNQVTEVTCEKMSYPHYDSDDDKIYINTHFATKEEAYQKAIEEREAGISHLTRAIKHFRSQVAEHEKRLADECIDLDRLREELKELEEAKDENTGTD